MVPSARALTGRTVTLAFISLLCVACGDDPQEQAKVTRSPASQKSEGQSPKAMMRAEEVAAARQEVVVENDVTIDRVRSETNEALAVADAFLKQQEQKYHAKINADLEAFQKRIDALRENAIAAAKEAKQTVSSELKELRSQMISTGTQLGEFGEKSQTELSKLNAELEQMLSVLETGAKPRDRSSKATEGSASETEAATADGSDA